MTKSVARLAAVAWLIGVSSIAVGGGFEVPHTTDTLGGFSSSLNRVGSIDAGGLGNLGTTVLQRTTVTPDLSLPAAAQGLTSPARGSSGPVYVPSPSSSGGGGSWSAPEWKPSRAAYVEHAAGGSGGGGGRAALRRPFVVAVCLGTHDFSDGCEDRDMDAASEALARAYLSEFAKGRALFLLRVRFPAAWAARRQMEDAIEIEQQGVALAIRLLQQNALQRHFTWFDSPNVIAAKTFLARYDSAQRDHWARTMSSIDSRPTTVASTRSTKTIEIPSGLARAQAHLIDDTKQWRGQ
jgi:hypothetical protein